MQYDQWDRLSKVFPGESQDSSHTTGRTYNYSMTQLIILLLSLEMPCSGEEVEDLKKKSFVIPFQSPYWGKNILYILAIHPVLIVQWNASHTLSLPALHNLK